MFTQKPTQPDRHNVTPWAPTERERCLLLDSASAVLINSAASSPQSSSSLLLTSETFSHCQPCDLTLPKSFTQLATHCCVWKWAVTNTIACFIELCKCRYSYCLNEWDFNRVRKFKAALINMFTWLRDQLLCIIRCCLYWQIPIEIITIIISWFCIAPQLSLIFIAFFNSMFWFYQPHIHFHSSHRPFSSRQLFFREKLWQFSNCALPIEPSTQQQTDKVKALSR